MNAQSRRSAQVGLGASRDVHRPLLRDGQQPTGQRRGVAERAATTGVAQRRHPAYDGVCDCVWLDKGAWEDPDDVSTRDGVVQDIVGNHGEHLVAGDNAAVLLEKAADRRMHGTPAWWGSGFNRSADHSVVDAASVVDGRIVVLRRWRFSADQCACYPPGTPSQWGTAHIDGRRDGAYGDEIG